MKRYILFFYMLLSLLPLQLGAQEIVGAAQPTKDFLLGKTHFEMDTNFVQIPPQYTVLRNPNNFIQKKTLEAFFKMWEAALKDGVKLTATSASRNFWVQRYIWEQKWHSSNVPAGADRARSILRYNSMCGTSRHHWGTELDFNSPKLTYWNTPDGKRTYKWLCENAHKFGFYQPYSAKGPGLREHGYNEEKWHWSYFPLSDIYMQKYKELVTDEDLKGFMGEKHVGELKVIEHYVLGVALSPEV